MTYSITLGWWIVPLLLSALIGWVFSREGDPLVGGVFLVAGAGLICFVWMVYFGIGWALA